MINISDIDGGASRASIFVDAGKVVGAETDIPGLPPAAEPSARAAALTALLCRTRAADFEVSELPHDSLPEPVALSIPNLLIHGIKSVESTATVMEWLGDPSVELIAAPDILEILGSAVLEPQEGYFVSQLGQAFGLGITITSSPIGRDAAARLLCALRFSNAVVSTGTADTWMSGDEPSPATVATVDMTEVARVCYLVDEKLRAIEAGADHYAVLDVERRAPVDRIKANYRELAKMFHPDRHALLAIYNEGIKDSLESIFNGLTEAYQTLSHPKEREAYDRTLSLRDQQTAVHSPAYETPGSVPTPKPPTERTATAAPPLRPETPGRSQPPPPPPTPAHGRPSQRSGVESRTVHQDDLSRKPGKLDGNERAGGRKRPNIPVPLVPPVPRAPKPRPEDGPPDARTSNAQQARSAPTAVPKLHPDTLYEHGVTYAESGDFERAIHAFMRGVELAPQDARMHAALGGAMADLHGLDKPAEASLRKAVEIDPNSADLFVELGKVYERCGRPSEARTLFKRALLLDPANALAIEALGGKPANKEINDFFKNVFKK